MVSFVMPEWILNKNRIQFCIINNVPKYTLFSNMKNSINMVARFIYWMSKQRLMSHSTNIRLHFTINNTGNTNQTHTTNRNTIKQVNWTQYTINNNIKRILKYNIRMAELREGEKICLTVSIWYTNNDTWMHRLFCIYTVVQKKRANFGRL